MDAPYVAVLSAGELPSGTFRKVVHAGRAYLIAHVQGRYYALEDLCSHEDYPLSYGCLAEGKYIKCSLHGSRFRLEDGQPIEDPARTPVRTFDVVCAEDRIWLDPANDSAP